MKPSTPFEIAGSAVRCVWPAAAQLGEGTWWSQRRQALWWLDILGRQLMLYTPATGAWRSWPMDDMVSAVAECAEGRALLVTVRQGFARFEPDAPGARLVMLHSPADEPAGNRFNDGKCDAAGRFWGGSMDFDCERPTGALYRYGPAGDCTRMDEGYTVVNGPTWSADGRRMYVNNTARNHLHVYDFDPATGDIGGKRSWLRFEPGEGLPDGMTTDAQGRLWIAHWGGSCVSCRDPETGQVRGRIRLPTQHVTDCAFGGPDLQTLFISTARTGLTEAELQAQPLAGALFQVDLSGLASGVVPTNFAGAAHAAA